MKTISSELIRADLNELYSSKVEFERKIGSTKNKLQRFTHPQMRRIMGLQENNIHLYNTVEKQWVLLCNLQASESDLVGRENMRALGTFQISELWENFRKRTAPQEFYLIVDEMQEYMTPDLVQVLPQSSKYGLHCILAHQDPGQLTPQIEAAIKNAQTKVFFSTENDPKRQRQFTFRTADGKTTEVMAPLVRVHEPPQDRIDRYVEELTRQNLTPEEVDARLNRTNNEVNPDDTQDGYAAR